MSVQTERPAYLRTIASGHIYRHMLSVLALLSPAGNIAKTVALILAKRNEHGRVARYRCQEWLSRDGFNFPGTFLRPCHATRSTAAGSSALCNQLSISGDGCPLSHSSFPFSTFQGISHALRVLPPAITPVRIYPNSER